MGTIQGGPVRTTTIALAIAGCILASACAGSNPTGAPPPTGALKGRATETAPGGTGVSPESPVPVESNPPGDIPDSIAFVPYRSAKGGFTITTPEGWARTQSGDSVLFTDKLNTVVVSWTPATSAPTVTSAKQGEMPTLQRTTRAFALKSISSTSLPAGPAVLIDYQANSDPNRVTGKQYRQDILRYELFHAGKEFVLSLLSPVGADNVDPWRTVTESFSWR
jgi:hypothetical protein